MSSASYRMKGLIVKRYEVQICHLYAAKVSGRLVPVKILYGIEAYGKLTRWIALDLETGEQIEIKSGANLKYEMFRDENGTFRRVRK